MMQNLKYEKYLILFSVKYQNLNFQKVNAISSQLGEVFECFP